MSLAAVTKGVTERPIKCLVYAPEGVGKSSFAAGAPGAVFIDVEDGSHRLDVHRFPVPESLSDVYEAIDQLYNDHDFKTVVIDTVDQLEYLLWKHMCERDKKSSIEAYGYGKGYTEAVDEWETLLGKLDGLVNQRGMNVILVGHVGIRTTKNPSGMDHDKYELRIHHKAAGVVKEWCDLVGFANYETTYSEDSTTGRIKATDTGRRLVYWQRDRGFDAKTRYDIPGKMELSWTTFAKHLAEARTAETTDYATLIEEEMKKLPDDKKGDIVDKVSSLLSSGADLQKLKACYKRLLEINKGG